MAIPKQVCICGGGNAAHVMGALTPSLLPDAKVHILTTFKDEADRWTKSLGDHDDKMTLVKAEPDKTQNTIVAGPALVSKKPEEAVPGSDVIFMPLPAFAHRNYLEAIGEHIKPGATVVGMPMYPGFVWMLKDVLGPEKAETIKVVGCDTLPWAARLTEYGVSAEVIGTKSQMLGCATDQATLEMPQACIGKFPVLQWGSGICADLMTTNPYIHLSVMYGLWSKWDGNPLDEEPLFYQGADAFTADIMTAVNDEVVLKTKAAILELKPELNLDRVVSIHQWYIDCYASQTEDTSTLQSCLNTNGGYRGLKHPCITTEDGKFLPNFGYRYMTEDLPMGLIPLRAIARMVGVETPTTDEVLLWCQKMCGKEYLVDGELKGKDIGETRAPVNFQITTIDQMLW